MLLLTNDGDLALRLTHPRYKIEKEYEVQLDRPFDTALTEKLLRGLYIPVDSRVEGQPPERVRAKAEAIHRLGPNKLKVILRQGLKRQIRLMFLEVGYEVKRLERVRLGPLRLGRLKTGAWRYLDAGEVAALRGGEKAGEGAAKVPLNFAARVCHGPPPHRGSTQSRRGERGAAGVPVLLGSSTDSTGWQRHQSLLQPVVGRAFSPSTARLTQPPSTT